MTQLDEEQVPLLQTGELPVRVAPPGHHRAAVRVERVEDRRGEQEVADLVGLAIQHLGAEEVGDGTRRLREIGEEGTRIGSVAEGDGRHLHASHPSLGAGREDPDLGLVQFDLELA